MLGHQFYRTQEKTARRMIAPYKQAIDRGARVLDPSAGDGAILDAIGCTTGKRQARNWDTDAMHKGYDAGNQIGLGDQLNGAKSSAKTLALTGN